MASPSGTLPQSLIANVDAEIFELALEGLLNKVSSKIITQTEYDELCLAKCDLEEVVAQAKLLGCEQKERRRAFHRIMGYFRKLVSPFDRYRSGIDTMVQASAMACLVWGALKMIMLAAHDLQQNFEVIADGLQLITDSLPNHQAYHSIAISEPLNPLRPPLIRIYVEVLTYSALATRYVKNGVLKTTGIAILRSDSHGFQKCITEIETQSTNINSLAIGDIWQNSNATIEELRTAIKVLRSIHISQQPSRQMSNKSGASSFVTSNVPGLLSNTFVSRKDDLTWISSVLEADSGKIGGRRAAIYGMTGVGKSQLVIAILKNTIYGLAQLTVGQMKILKYEENHRAQYAYRFWITSGSYAKVRTGIQEIIDILDLPERLRSEPHVQDTAFRAWLERTDDWLLMFDNVTEDDYKAVLELLPQGVPKGDILFTSQRPGAMDKLTGNLKTRCLRLEEFNSDEAVELFYLAGSIQRTEATESDATEIVKRNGFLPQAINQAASYIKHTNINLQQYLQQFGQNTETLLQYENTWDDRKAISVHMQISLESLRRNNRNSLNLLKLFAYFEPESIPAMRGWKRNSESWQLQPVGKTREGCFSKLSCFGGSKRRADAPSHGLGRTNSGFQASSESVHTLLKNDLSLDHALSQLRDFSLVKDLPEGHKLWMHDLTRFFVRQSIAVSENTSWISLALEVLFHTFPERDETVEERAIVDVFLPQAESLIGQARNAGIPLQNYAKLISICGVCFHDRSSYGKALDMFGIARPIYEKVLGLRNDKTLTLLHRIGWCHRAQGNLALSEKFYAQTLAGRKKVLPPESPDLFASMSDLASVIERQGRLKEGEELFRKCYESQKLAMGQSNPRTLAAAHNLALCYANQGRLGAGELLCQTTLNISKENYGDDDPGTLRTLSNLAVFIDHQGRLPEAVLLYEESLVGYKKRYGFNHPLTMRIRSNLGVMLRLQGKFQEAEFMLREVLSESIRLMGHDDVHVSLANFDLAEILHEAGKTEEALERYQLAITVFEFLDPKSPVLFRIFDGLGILYRETGNLVRAESMTKLSYDENMALLKWYDPYTLMAAHSRAEVMRQDGRGDAAQQLLDKILESFTELLGPTHPHVVMVKNSLACLKLQRKQFALAMSDFEEVKAGFVALVGEHHHCVAIVLMSMGRCQLELDNPEKARQYLEAARDELVTVLGAEHPHVAVAYFYLGIVAAQRGELPEAKTSYIKSIQLYKTSLGQEHPNCIRAAIQLLKILDVGGVESAIWLPMVNEALPGLHENGCMKSIPESLTVPIIQSSTFSDSWSPSDGLLWGESTRMRWGRKTVWREAHEGVLTG